MGHEAVHAALILLIALQAMKIDRLQGRRGISFALVAALMACALIADFAGWRKLG